MCIGVHVWVCACAIVYLNEWETAIVWQITGHFSYTEGEERERVNYSHVTIIYYFRTHTIHGVIVVIEQKQCVLTSI